MRCVQHRIRWIGWQLRPFMRSITQLLSLPSLNLERVNVSRGQTVIHAPTFVIASHQINYPFARAPNVSADVTSSDLSMHARSHETKIEILHCAATVAIGMHITDGLRLWTKHSFPADATAADVADELSVALCSMRNCKFAINHFGFEDAPLSCILIQRPDVDVCASVRT